jgi:hypothetical protein
MPEAASHGGGHRFNPCRTHHDLAEKRLISHDNKFLEIIISVHANTFWVIESRFCTPKSVQSFCESMPL